jgi:hypothetical protein
MEGLLSLCDHDSRNEDKFEFLKLLSQDMRHTAIVVWQFSIAIVTLQASAVSGGMLKC